MSSFKNAFKTLRRTHRERSQPAARAHLGLLEKHQDYVLRARDYARKQAQLRLLRERARSRNPDEFYFRMIRTRTDRGVHVAVAGASDPSAPQHLTAETLRLFATQDVAYLRTVRQAERRRVERLRATLHRLPPLPLPLPPGPDPVSRRNGSAGEQQSQQQEEEEADEHEQRQPSHSDATGPQPALRDSTVVRSVERTRRAAYRELEQREARLAQLTRALEAAELRQALMGKGTPRRVRAATTDRPAVYRWRQERKR